MARRTIVSQAHNGPVNGASASQAPPSTIAAQIVENHAQALGQQQPHDRTTFEELVDEIRSNPTLLEPDIESNAKLISVLAEAGLESRSKDDPFVTNDDADRHVLVSLEVIELAFTRNPNVLFYAEPSADVSASPPLFLWLFPRILALVDSHTNRATSARAESLISRFYTTLQRIPHHWHNASTILRFNQACANDVLLALEYSLANSTNGCELDVYIPSSGTRAVFCADSDQPIALRQSSQVRITCANEAIALIAATINTQCRIVNNLVGNESWPTVECRSWISDTLARSWRCLPNIIRRSNTIRERQQVAFNFMLCLDKSGSLEQETVRDHNDDIKTKVVLADCLSSVSSWPGDIWEGAFQKVVALSLSNMFLWTSNDLSQAFGGTGALESCLDLIFKTASQFPPVASDLSMTCCLIRTLHAEVLNSTEQPDTSEDVEQWINTIEDRHIRERASRVWHRGNGQNIANSQPPLKRRKQTGGNDSRTAVSSSPEKLMNELCSILGNLKREEMQNLPENIESLYGELESEDKVQFWMLMSRISCSISFPSPPGQQGLSPLHKNLLCNCENLSPNLVVPRPWDTEHWTLFYDILSRLVESNDAQLSRGDKVLAMAAVRRLVFHTSMHTHRDLRTSALGRWCMQCLSSSFRELRVAAGRTLPAFLIHESSSTEQLVAGNRAVAMKFLRKLSEKEEVRYAETMVLALGQVAHTCGHEELNLILLQLVDYLGHSNSLVCSSAHLELYKLATDWDISVEELLRPFWRTIAIAAVRDLPNRPQKVQQLADLLGTNVNRLLLLTQNETVPYLVLWNNLDALQRIAQVRDQSSTIWSLCMQERNLVAILSFLISNQTSELEKDIKAHLVQVSSQFKGEDASELVKLYPIAVACEILKLAGDEDGDAKLKVLDSFKEFTVLVERRGQQAKSSATAQARMASSFFENQALGIVASFVDIVDNPNQHVVEKKRCLRGMEEMIRTAGSNIRIALPQIRTCLQSALNLDGLRDLAFSAWITLLSALESDEDLEGLVDPTFTALVQQWNKLSPEMQRKAHDAVGTLLKNHNTLIQASVDSIPSLASIPLMSKFESQLARFKAQMDTSQHLYAFSRRCEDENSSVVLQALRELLSFLENEQQWIHDSAATEQPNQAIAAIMRALLDVCVRFNEDVFEISDLAARCLGVIGCLDPSRIETVKEKKEMIAHSNFEKAGETVEFVANLLEDVLVKAFHSTSNLRAQGFLAYVMQELLKFCGFSKESTYRPHGMEGDETLQRWNQMPESVRTTLTPFLSSRYALKSGVSNASTDRPHPILSSLPSLRHGVWLREFVFDLLQKSKGDNARKLFLLLARVIRGYDIAIANFLLPYAAANVIIGGTEAEVLEVLEEIMIVLKTPVSGKQQGEAENLRLCSQNVFQILEYLSRWAQDMKKVVSTAKTQTAKVGGRANAEFEEISGLAQIQSVEKFLAATPAALIAQRAVECGSYARALLHWEVYMRQQEGLAAQGASADDEDALYQHLQKIYSQIDEPDGIEGVLAQMSTLTPEQTILEHRKAGRWTAAQSWYELRLQEDPSDIHLQNDLLSCFQEAGQYNMLLEQAKNLPSVANSRMLSMICEATWNTERWEDLETFLSSTPKAVHSHFSSGIGSLLLAQRSNIASEEWLKMTGEMRATIVRSLSSSTTTSLQACHNQLLQLHALHEMEHISGLTTSSNTMDSSTSSRLLQRRLEVIGAFITDKQYILGIRRAAMNCTTNHIFERHNVAESWTTSARLARKSNSTTLAYDSVLRALRLGDGSAKIEQARLLWKEGEHRKAIQSLENVIESNVLEQQHESFASTNVNHSIITASITTTGSDSKNARNLLVARAHLLLAKWQDRAGQTSSETINKQYQLATKTFQKWEKGLYYLGRFYNKLLESQKTLPLSKQSVRYLGGETSKLVIENYLRSMVFGCKYLFETLPKLLTLWLDFGVELSRTISKEVPDDVRASAMDLRPKMLDTMNSQVKKYTDKIPMYLFYTALAQMITRISHPNQKVYDVLALTIVKVITAHPQQGLWSLLAVVKSSAPDRASRGVALLNKLKDRNKAIRNEGMNVDLKSLVTQGQRLSDGLLQACEVAIEGRQSHVSLSKELRFNHKLAPCGLVIPLDKTLSASLPTTTSDNALLRNHRAFPMTREAITVSSFADEVLVLASLQKPRKLTVRGTDGRKYGLLCKPNDDLRKDQRLMEFNAMINRSLKKDAPSSTRRLYIKTYAVTPLNEACGLIEWVDGLKPMRDILLHAYRAKGVRVDYNQLRSLLDEACASRDPSIFTDQIIPAYPALLHEWFTELFPDPEAWFAARTRYTRSCAVASLVGHVLGLGDRHGENVLLEESTGGVFHVDFNCLFDKGLTFEKPEMVPFRLTHNMVDAMGACGTEGPFRRSAECTLRVMRSNMDALLTILETFVYDPTADFVGRRKIVKGVPETPKEVLDGVRGKVEGFLRGESVPLGVEGYVDWVVGQARDPMNLAAMYIGWCAFL